MSLSEPWSFGSREIKNVCEDTIEFVFDYTPGLPATLLAMPVIFALIPSTLRKARVKSSHILRIFYYSLIAPLAIIFVWIVTYFSLRMLDLRSISRLILPSKWQIDDYHSFISSLIYDMLPGMILVIPCTLWMVFWWHQACKHYLKLKETRSIVLLLTIVLLLLATAIEMNSG